MLAHTLRRGVKNQVGDTLVMLVPVLPSNLLLGSFVVRALNVDLGKDKPFGYAWRLNSGDSLNTFQLGAPNKVTP